MRIIGLREANQNFSRVIAEVEAGETVIITRQGRRIARISPERSARSLSAAQRQALARLRSAMQQGYHFGPLPGRDALHER